MSGVITLMALETLPCDYQPITIVEIVLDRDPGTGESYNMAADKCAWQCGAESFWFSDCKAGALQLAYAGKVIEPWVASVKPRCSTLNLGEGISTRGTIEVCFNDCPIDCTGVIPGNYFAVLKRQQKYWENRIINVYYGDCSQDITDMDKETYLIDGTSGPGSDCIFCIKGKDPLSIVANKNVSCGSGLTFRDATNSQLTPLILSKKLDSYEIDPDTDLAGTPDAFLHQWILGANYEAGDPTQDEQFSCIQHVCVDGEVLDVVAMYNIDFGPPGWNLKLTGRAACGSELKAHAPGAKIQPAMTFKNCHVADAIRRLFKLANYEDISLVCCDGAEVCGLDCESLEDFRCKNPLAIIHETVICPPVPGYTTMLNELARDFGFTLVYDPETCQVNVICVRPPEDDTPVTIIEECDVVEGTLKVTDGAERYSAVCVDHGPIDCAKNISDGNLGISTEIVDIDALQEPCERRKYRTTKVKKTKSRWFGNCGTYLAQTYGDRVICLSECPREKVSFQTTPAVACRVKVGEYAALNMPKIQDGFGMPDGGSWLLVGKCRSGKQNKMLTLHFERLFGDNAPAPAFACDDTNPDAENLYPDLNACEMQDCAGVF